MKRYGVKIIALILSVVMLMSATSCRIVNSIFGGSETEHTERTASTDGTDRTDATSDTDASSGTTSDTTASTSQQRTKGKTLNFPDHVATVAEIHPGHAQGNVKGADATKLLNEVERDIISRSVTSYFDATILFEHPENYGIEVDSVTWGTVNSDDSDDTAYYQGLLDKLYTIDSSTLGKDDKIFYDKVVWDLEEFRYLTQYNAFDYYESILNPLTGPQCEILFDLDIIPVTTKEEAENYILLVKDIDRYYDEICDFEEDRARYGFASGDDTYKAVAESFDNLVKMKDTCFLYDSFKTKVNSIKGLSDAEKKDLIARHDDAMKNVMFPEFEECAERMRKLVGSGGKGTGLTEFTGSDAYYSAICRKLTNSSKTVEELKNDLDSTVDSVTATLAATMSSRSFNYLSYLVHSYSKGDVDQNLDFLKDKISADFPVLHEHSYQKIDVPKDMEENFSPAAYLGYHLDNYDSNQIIVNRKKSDTDFGITCAHEGYPGHLFQSVYTRANTSHPYLYLFDSIGYAEGWAMYAETYAMKYYDSDDSIRTVVKIFDELNVLLMARCDIGIHTEGWSCQDCADYFTRVLKSVTGVKYTTKILQEMYDVLVSDPGYAVKYGSGFVNTGLVIQAAHDQFPDATDLEIHTAYLNAMPGTFEQIKENMINELKG